MDHRRVLALLSLGFVHRIDFDDGMLFALLLLLHRVASTTRLAMPAVASFSLPNTFSAVLGALVSTSNNVTVTLTFRLRPETCANNSRFAASDLPTAA